MAGTMALYPESPLDPDDVVYPCKGCGEILEEGKAFELAGHRWHLECFKCNTCHTILDSDANLLLLGDGSLICNNCTYSCNACGNKIQDLAILTGDQAYCASCFRCRNCKKKIENLRYARTSQGMFCMDCHDALMARRRKKTKNAAQRLKQQGSHMLLDKSLPSLPPNAVMENSSFSPDSGGFSGPSTPTELPAEVPARRGPVSRSVSHEASSSIAPQELDGNDSLAAPVRPSNRTSASEASDGDGMMISLQLDPSLVATPPVEVPSNEKPVEMDVRPPSGSDYFGRNGDTSRRPAQESAKASANPSNARTSAQTSPRTSLKDAGRNLSETRLDILNTTSPRASADRSREPSPLVPPPRREPEQDRFKLQEAPPGRKKSIGAKDAILSPRASEMAGDSRRPTAASTPKAQSSGTSTPQAELASPSFSQGNAQDSSASSSSHPKRGDSLLAGKANSNQVIQRKEVAGSRNPSSQPASGGVDSPSSSSFNPSSAPNGGLLIGKPIESPMSKSFMDYPQKSDKRPVPGSAGGESFASPRAAPEPEKQRHQRKPSASLASGKAAEGPETSPKALISGDPNDEKNGVDQEHSLLKRMSNSVRHARTNSDRTAGRNSRDKSSWPKSPLNGTNSDALANISLSPSLGSPDSVSKDAEYYRSQLQAQRQRGAEKDKKIAELLEMVEGPKTTIKQMNTELREKRSTMVVLDTQKEIVVRELELLQPMAAAKKSGSGSDISKSTPAALKDFAAALQKLKDQFAPEIEELMEKKSSIQEDIARLTRERDRLQQEFDQLSIVNQRLIDATNETTASRMAEHNQQQAQGLGIYGPAGDRLRDARPPSSETHTTNSTLVQDLHGEEPVVYTVPKVVDVRKNNRAKFNWKKGGIVAKTVGKNLKDAFSSERSQQAEYQNGAYPSPQNLEGTPYGATQAGQYPSTTLPKDYKMGGEGQGAIGLFGAQQKGGRPGPSPVPGRSTPQSQLSSFAGEPVEPPHKLFGSMLQARADYEGVDIPCIVVRCVQEVQSRGMDVEGIYRKSGGTAQINEIKAGFEKSNDYDISDVDLDIHAVTSTLKQYFRRLPNPLITFDVYDRLIATAPRAPAQPMMGGGMKGGENGGAVELTSKEERIRKTREALAGLPKAHGATLSFLVFHLAKIRKEEARNLMHSLNLAVVFAPTIMRPVEIAREMLDTPGKNDCVRFMIENCEDLFLRG